MNPNDGQREDLRVQRTNKLILEALLELTAQKGFSALTVSDITKYAGINRATFYRHYEDKYDLLNTYAQTVYQMLEDESLRSNEVSDHQMYAGLIKIFDHIRTNARFYRGILGKNGDPAFTDKIRQYIQKRIRRSLPVNLHWDKDAMDFYVAYSSSASVGAVLWWLEHEFPYSSEEMATFVRQLELGSLMSMLRSVGKSK
jgi:AcrR family transcriptional regulator